MATLTSTGAVNLTSSTNWSPAQIPATGDDLVIGAHTLTLDADLVLGSVTFNNADSRLAFTGPTRSVEATNGWYITGAVAATFLTTTVTTGNSLTLTGKWTTSGSATNAGFTFAAITGGALTLRTVGSSPSAILWECIGNTVFRLVNTGFTAGTLNTIGRLECYSNQSTKIVDASGGTWNHTSSGLNRFAATFANPVINLAAGSVISWAGDLTHLSTQATIGTGNGWSGTATLIGNFSQESTGILFFLGTANSGVFSLTGNISTAAAGTAIRADSGTFNWQNQTVTLPATKEMRIFLGGGTVSISGLIVENYGRFNITRSSGSLITSNLTQIRNYFPTGQAGAIFSDQLDGKIIQLGVDAPTLPAVETVAAGEVYGYVGFELTGTGLIVDPAIISSAVLAAQMSTLQRNPTLVIERTLEDVKPLTFSWPNSTDVVQGQVSFDNGNYVSVAGTVAYLRSEHGRHYYTLAYNSADRPTEEGTARYRFYSGSHNIYATLRVLKASPVLQQIKEGLAVEATSQNILSGVTSLNNNDRGEFF